MSDTTHFSRNAQDAICGQKLDDLINANELVNDEIVTCAECLDCMTNAEIEHIRLMEAVRYGK
jgi:hypothetical protein